jgi:hypothetical protein
VSPQALCGVMKVRRAKGIGSTLAPNRSPVRHWRMPTLEVVSLILVVVVWIVLLRSFSAD